MKVLLDVEKVGVDMFTIKSEDGMFCLSSWSAVGWNPVEYKNDKSSIKNVLKLKEVGFTAEDILEMKRECLI